MAVYPNGIPSIPGDGSWTHDQVAREIEAIATELGTNPRGPSPTVADRLWHAPARALPGYPVGAYNGGTLKTAGTVPAGNTGCTWINEQTIAVDIIELRLCWTVGVTHPGTDVNTGEVKFPNSIPIKAAVELGRGGTVVPVLFRGQRQGTLDPGGILVSDPIAVDIAAGTVIRTRNYTSLASGQSFGWSIGTISPGMAPNTTYGGYTWNSDIADATTDPTNFTATNYMGPNLLLGVPLNAPGKSLYAVGDSVDAGGGPNGDDNSYYARGWLARAINGSIPMYRATYDSNCAHGYRLAHATEAPVMGSYTHLLCGYGTNDIYYGRTLAQIQGDLTWIYQRAKARGLKVCQRTILPRTDSGNTAPLAGFEAGSSSIRGQLNAWIRAGGGGLIDLVVETADKAESARDSGLWKAGYTTDGAHPNATGAPQVATALTVSMLP